MKSLLLLTLVILLNVLGVSTEADLTQPTNWANKCTSILQSIVEDPEVCAQKYLEKLNNELKKKTSLLFSPQANSIIENFEQTYGVQITVNSPFTAVEDETCFQYSNSTLWEIESDVYISQFDNSGDYSISSISLYIETNPFNVSDFLSGLAFAISDTLQGFLIYPYGCPSDSSGIKATFSDSAPTPATCDNLNNNMMLRPYDSFMDQIKNFNITFANPALVFFQGLDSQAPTLINAVLTLCTRDIPKQSGSITSDIARSNLNIAGFRSDNGYYHLTSIYEYLDGQMQYVTISVPMSNVVCK